MALTDYGKYQLEWMIEHGYSLSDLFNKMDDIVDEIYHESDRPLPSEAFESFEEVGFIGSEIWASEDEWLYNEALKEDGDEISSKSSNKMDKICALLGVELFQKFNIVEIYGPNALRDKLDGKIRNPYYFTDEGLVNSSGVCDNHKLANLINGRFKIEITKEQF